MENQNTFADSSFRKRAEELYAQNEPHTAIASLDEVHQQLFREKELRILELELELEANRNNVTHVARKLKEELYDSLLTASPDTITVTDLEGNIEISSPASLKMFGYTSESEIVGRNILEFIDPTEHERGLENLATMFTNNLSGSDEYTAIKTDGTQFPLEVNADIIRDKDGNPIKIVFIARDITSRKEALTELKQSEELYRSLLIASPDSIAVTNLEGVVEISSPATTRLFGYSAQSEVAGKNILEFIHPIDHARALQNLQLMFNEQFFEPIEYLGMRSDGSTFPFEVTGEFIKDENGNPTKILFISRDISFRKQAQEAITQSEEKFSKAFLTAPYAIAITQIEDGRFVEINDTFANYSGYTREETLLNTVYSLNIWENNENRNDVVKALAEGRRVFENEYTFRKKSGELKVGLYSASIIHINDKKLVLSSILDISDRKRNEEQILKTSRMYSVKSRMSQAIVHFREKEALLNEVCRIATEVGEFRMAWVGLIHNDSDLVKPYTFAGHVDGYLQNVQDIQINRNSPQSNGPTGRAIKTGELVVCNNIATDPNMRVWREKALERGYYSSISLPLKHENEVIGTFSIYSSKVDFFNEEEIKLLAEMADEISYALEAIEIEKERIEAENQLLLLSHAVEQSPVSIVITSLDGQIEYANPKAAETTGYNVAELIGQNPRVLKSGEMSQIEYETLWENISHGKEWHGVFHNKRKDGTFYWESSSISPVMNNEGKITHYIAIKEDITQRKLHEKQLQQSEERFSQLAQQSLTVVWEVDANGLYTYISPLVKEQWGYDPEDVVNKMYFYDLCPSINREEFKKKALEFFQTKNSFKDFENIIITADGTERWVSTNGIPLLNDAQELIGYRGADTDITQRKLADIEIRKFRTMSDQANYGTAISTLEGEVIYANDAFCTMHGFEKAEIIGQHFTHFYNKTDLDRVNYLFNSLQSNNGIQAEKTLQKRKDGTQFPALLSASFICDEHGTPQYAYASFVDITDITEKEVALRKSEAELNYAQEIGMMGSWEHNLSKNTLTGSANYYRLLGIDKQTFEGDLYKHFISVVHPDDLKIVVYMQQAPFVTSKIEVVEMRILQPDGSIKWVQNNIVPVFEGEQLVALKGVNIDITERKVAQEAIQQSEERLNYAQQIGDMGSWELNLESGEFYWSDNYYRMMGLQPQQKGIGNSYFRSRIVEDDYTILEKLFDEIKSTHEPATAEIRYIKPNGQIGWLQDNVVPLFENNKMVGIKGAIVDITTLKTAEQQLKSQHDRLNAIISALPDLIFILDKNGVYEEAFVSNYNDLAAPLDQIMGKRLHDIFDEKESELHLSKIQKSLQTQSLISYEYTLVRNKQKSHFDARIVPIGSEKVLSLIRNITDKKEKEDEIKKLSLAVEQSPVSIVITDLVGDIEYANAAFLRTTGYSYDELIGTNTRILKSGTTDESVYQELWTKISKGETWLGEWQNRKKNGDLFWEEIAITPIFDETGNVTSYLAVKQDISERKKAEQEIQDLNTNLEKKIIERTTELGEKSALLSDLLHSIPDLVFFKDLNGVYLGCNSEFGRLTDRNISDIVGRTDYDIFEKGIADFFRQQDQLMLENGIPRHNDEWITYPDGSLKLIDTFKAPLRDEKGKILGLLGISRDLTERKKIEEDLVNARKEAERANLAKSEFLSRMSHELRTPMNSILGFAQLLDMGALNAGQKKGVGHILRSGNHLLELINEILDISRIEAGRMSLTLESVQLVGVIDEMIEVVKPLAKDRNITIEFERTDTDQLFVTADKKRLKQIMLNLLNNAVKYNNKNGFVSINCETITKADAEAHYLRISVTDTGIGIAETDLPKIFNPFERINADQSKIEGTGLGLAVVQKLVDAMDGEIGVSSRQMKGSTFWVDLPMAEGQIQEPESKTESNVVKANGIEKTGRIFYIEDKISNIELVSEILEVHRPNIELLTSKVGRYAVNLTTVHQPNLILLDLDLPDIYGGEVLKNLQANDYTITVPVVILSADAMPKKIEHLMKSGACDYLTKPLDINLFLSTIDKWMLKKQ